LGLGPDVDGAGRQRGTRR